jgi:hypothetical protein
MLFKILHGDKARISTNITPYHEGYCYVTHDGEFYVDMNNERVKLNAKDCETIAGASLDSILNSINSTVDKISTISLPASGWTEATNIYSQVVSVTGVTANSKVDIYPTPEQLVDLQISGISLVAVNQDGVVTVYAMNNKPISDYNMQVTLTELSGVV